MSKVSACRGGCHRLRGRAGSSSFAVSVKVSDTKERNAAAKAKAKAANIVLCIINGLFETYL